MTARPATSPEPRARAAEHEPERRDAAAVRAVYVRDGYWAARVKAGELGYNAYAARILVDLIETEGNAI